MQDGRWTRFRLAVLARLKAGNSMASPYFILLLLVASPALAQPTTTTVPPTCTQISVAELQAAVADDPDWFTLTSYAARRHYGEAGTAEWVNPTRCLANGNLMYSVGLNYRYPTRRQPVGLILLPSLTNKSTRAKLAYPKNRTTLMVVTTGISWRMKLYPDGSLRRGIPLDFNGHRIRTSTSTTLAGTARRRVL